jgi:two-component system, NarL family, response regulator NreC
MRIRVLLGDDHEVVRQGLRSLLEQQEIEVVGEAADGHEVIRLCRNLNPDAAVLDVSMPLLNGIEATREIKKECPRTKVILLTMHSEHTYVLQGLRAGASGYLLKSNSAGEVVQAVRQVCKGEVYLSSGIAGDLVEAYLAKADDAAPDPLSDRERQVVQLIAEGKSTKEIADILGISPKTAASHRNNIMEKLGIHDAVGLTRYAIRSGLIKS